MKLQRAQFEFDVATVAFTDGQVAVSVRGGAEVVYDNVKGAYKPCVTHCNRLVGMVRGETRPRKIVNKKPSTPILPNFLYTKSAAMEALGIGPAAWQSLRNHGLRVRIIAKRAFVKGQDLIEVIEKNG